MFDIMPCPAPSRGTNQVLPSTKAQRFVNGDHTAADETTRQIILHLLEEIGVLDDASLHLTANGATARVNKRTAEKVEKQICFMASFLRTADKVEWFGILMDRHRWTGTPCGYTAAKTVTTALRERGYILLMVEPRKGHSAVYTCSEALRDRLTGWRALLNFKRANPHPVEVREPKKDHLGSFRRKRLPLDRFPSCEVQRHEATVIRINNHLSRHHLADGQGRLLDTTLSRIFTGSLKSGGRLYADYQNRREVDRLHCTIDGEPVCEIDLKASHVAILAALYQHPERLPQDPYQEISWVDTPRHRKAAKNIVQCAIHADGGRPTRFPRQDNGVPFKDKYGLGDKKMADLLLGILEVMPFLDGSPCLTLDLQFLEAEILIYVLERCRLQDIPAFPIHDSLLVKQSEEEDVLCTLQESLRAFLGPHAPWLDVSVSGASPRLVEPLPCPMDAECRLHDWLKDPSFEHIRREHLAEVVDMERPWDF